MKDKLLQGYFIAMMSNSWQFMLKIKHELSRIKHELFKNLYKPFMFNPQQHEIIRPKFGSFGNNTYLCT